MSEIKKLNKYFLCHKNEGGTYDIADKKGYVFALGVRSFYVFSDKKDYIITENTDFKETLWNKEGEAMPGAKDVLSILISPDGCYEVKAKVNGKWIDYDNGARAKRAIKKTLGWLCIVAAVAVPTMAIKVYVENMIKEDQVKKEADDKLNASYLGATYLGEVYFDTDTNIQTAEFKAKISTDEEAVIWLNMQEGETKKVGEWRAQGLDMKRIAEDKQNVKK